MARNGYLIPWKLTMKAQKRKADEASKRAEIMKKAAALRKQATAGKVVAVNPATEEMRSMKKLYQEKSGNYSY